jgi:hypothetical protein
MVGVLIVQIVFTNRHAPQYPNGNEAAFAHTISSEILSTLGVDREETCSIRTMGERLYTKVREGQSASRGDHVYGDSPLTLGSRVSTCSFWIKI